MSITAPTDIASCKLWLDAALGITLDGSSKISTWADQSGNGNDFTQATAGDRPVIAAADYNGHDVVQFVARGVTDGTYLQGPNLFSGASAAEMFIVVKVANDPPSGGQGSGMWKFGSAGSVDHYPYSDGNIYDGCCSTSRQTVGNPTPSLSAAYRVANVTSKSGGFTWRLDGTQIFTTASNTVGFYATPLIGKQLLSTGYSFDGKVAGVYGFNAELSSGERSDMLAYIAARFASAPAFSGNTFRVLGFIG